MTFETIDQSDEKTWHDQKRPTYLCIVNCVRQWALTIAAQDNPGDLWHLRHWLQFWQLRTWIHDNLCYLTIKSDIGQHSQFLRCLNYPTWNPRPCMEQKVVAYSSELITWVKKKFPINFQLRYFGFMATIDMTYIVGHQAASWCWQNSPWTWTKFPIGKILVSTVHAKTTI